MKGNAPEVELRAPLSAVLDVMADGTAPAVSVTDKDGLFLGYVTRENIGELMVLQRARSA
jgi:stage IV sporulation protein FB